MRRESVKLHAALEPQFKLWLFRCGMDGGFGDGKWRLLQAIDREGSLRAAATILGISYRKAWGDLKKAEQCLNTKLIEKRRGGPDGGETRLTAAGKCWVAAYRRFRRHVEKAVKKELAAMISGCDR